MTKIKKSQMPRLVVPKGAKIAYRTRKKPLKKRVRTKARGAGNDLPTTLGGMRL